MPADRHSPSVIFHWLLRAPAGATSSFGMFTSPLRVKRTSFPPPSARRFSLVRPLVALSPFLCFSSHHRPASSGSHRSLRTLPDSIKHVTVPPTPCEPSRPVLSVCFHRETLRIALLPRGWPQCHRARFTVASTLRCVSALAKHSSIFSVLP